MHRAEIAERLWELERTHPYPLLMNEVARLTLRLCPLMEYYGYPELLVGRACPPVVILKWQGGCCDLNLYVYSDFIYVDFSDPYGRGYREALSGKNAVMAISTSLAYIQASVSARSRKLTKKEWDARVTGPPREFDVNLDLRVRPHPAGGGDTGRP